jgi:hypothetical protein
MAEDPTRPKAAVDAEVNARLADILSPVFSEQEREQAHELTLQQLGFFRRELRRMVAFVVDTPGLGRTPGVRDVLESVLDTTSDLHQELLSRFQIPALDVKKSVEMPFDEVGIGTRIEDEDTGPSTSVETLAASLEGLKDGVLVIRESLLESETVAQVLADAHDFARELARGELLELASTLKELVDSVVEVLAMMPSPDAAAGAAPAYPRQDARAQQPSLIPGPIAIPMPPETIMVPRAPTAAIVPPEEPISPEDQPASDEDVVRELQDFFNANSPEGVLLRGAETAFARLVAAALVRVCPGVTVKGAELTARIKVLKDTFALRRKLKNTLTLREFRSLFGAAR